MASGVTQFARRSTTPATATWRENVSRFAPIVILAMFAALCLALSDVLNIWQDEAYSLHSSGTGVGNALRQGIGFEAQAPLYFGVLAAWRLVNASALYARLLSVIFSVITLYTSWRFARRYLKRVDAVLILGVLALNPFTIWAAGEIRPYAAVTMFAALLTYLFFRGFIDEEPSNAARLAYVLTAILGIYTQYYVALILPANGAALLVLRRPKSFVVYLAAMVPVAASLVPLASVIPQQLKSYHALGVAFKLPKYAMMTAVLEYAFPHNWIGSWTRHPGLNAIYLIVAVICIAIAVLSIRYLSVTSKILITANSVMFSLFTAAIVIAHVHVLVPRHSIVMLVPVTLLSFALIGDVLPERRRVLTAIYLTSFTVFALLSLVHDYRSMAKLGDWKRVSSFLRMNAKPTDLVTVFNAEAELPLRFYFHGRNVVQAIPRSMTFETFDEDAFVLRDDREVADTFGKVSAGHRYVWLVESAACTIQGDFFGCRRLEHYTNEHFKVIRTVRFSGSTVIELNARRAARIPARTSPSVS